MPRAGLLNRRVNFEQRSAAQDSAGQQVRTFVLMPNGANVAAGIDPISGTETFKAAQDYTDISHLITIRYSPNFSDPKTMAAVRIRWPRPGLPDRFFNIRAVLNTIEGNYELVFICDEGRDEGA